MKKYLKLKNFEVFFLFFLFYFFNEKTLKGTFKNNNKIINFDFSFRIFQSFF